MLLGTVRHGPGLRLLLPGHLRAAGAALLVICVAAILAAFLAARGIRVGSTRYSTLGSSRL